MNLSESEIERRRAWGRRLGHQVVKDGDWERRKNSPNAIAIRLKSNRKRGKQLVKTGVWTQLQLKGLHVRWHTNRGIKKLGCEFCQAE